MKTIKYIFPSGQSMSINEEVFWLIVFAVFGVSRGYGEWAKLNGIDTVHSDQVRNRRGVGQKNLRHFEEALFMAHELECTRHS